MKNLDNIQSLTWDELRTLVEASQKQIADMAVTIQRLQANNTPARLCPQCGASMQIADSNLVNDSDSLFEALESERESILSSARVIGYHTLVHEILHQSKNELLDLSRSLEDAKSTNKMRASQILDDQIKWIKNRVQEIASEFDQAQYVPVNINSVIQNVLRLFSSQLKGKSIILSAYPRIDIPAIAANEAEIKDIMVNLLYNALKAIQVAKRKKGEITVVTNIINQQRIEYIKISVQDNGIGIQNESQKHIFDRGFTTYETGTGMGLYITARILDSYGGKIDVESTVGKGTIFHVLIPTKRNQI